MLAYSIIMFAVAVLLVVFALFIYRGKVELVHSYHYTRVKDIPAYCKAMGKALAFFSLPFITAGILAFFTKGLVLTAVLFVGIIIASVIIWKVQKKYNGGIF